MIWGGLLVYAFTALKRHFLPPLPHVATINTICIAVAAGLLSGALFLSLRGVFTETAQRKRHFGSALAASIALFVMFLGYYYAYLYVTRLVNKIEDEPSNFHQLVEAEQNDKSYERQPEWARLTYEMYGVRLAYHRDANSWTYYVPSSDEVKLREQADKMTAAAKYLRTTSRGLLYAAVNIVITVFLTFLIGLFWATFRRATPAPPGEIIIDPPVAAS